MTDGGGKKCKKRGKVKAENFSGMDMNLAKLNTKSTKPPYPQPHKYLGKKED